MRLGLAGRLALIFGCLVALTALVTTLAGVVSTNAQVNDDVDRFLRARADEIVKGDRLGPNDRGDGRRRTNPGTVESVDDEAVVLAVDADAEVQELDREGNVVSTVGVGLPVDPVDVGLAQREGSDLLRTVSIDGVDYRMITSHISGGGAVQVARNLNDTRNLLGTIQTRMVTIGLGLSAVAAAAGWLVARRTTRPLRTLTESVERVAATQDLSTAIGLQRSDEIGRLADGFDSMLNALAVSRQQQHRLVNDAAHELRTPLTSIHANIELLAHAPDLDASVRAETLNSVGRELQQLNLLFTEIIELATDARDTPEHQLIDLAVVVTAAVRSFEARSETSIDLHTTPSPVLGDPVALERAAGNLIGNAEKYSPDGAPIKVEVADGSMSVTDRGPGIPDDEVGRVFDRFYRSDQARSQPGSGLGLAIVKKIVDDHQGEAWIVAAPEGGTTAGFTIPSRNPSGIQ